MEVNPFQPQKLLLYRDRVEASLKGALVYPVSVELDLSNTCNHHCPFCSFGTEESQGYRYQAWQHFPYPRILDLIYELCSVGVQSLTFTGGGEPLMHQHAPEILRTATKWKLPWGLVTNGSLLTDERLAAVAEGATFCRISLDAGDPETHRFTHGVRNYRYGAEFYDIFLNIEALRKAAPGITIGVSFCVMDENHKQIYRAAQSVRDAGANYLEVRPTFPTDWRGDGWTARLSDPEAAKVEVEHARLHLNSDSFQVIGMRERFDNVASATPIKRYQECRIGPLTTVIGADGRVWHCCVQRGQSFFELGSVAARSFPEVWAEIHGRRDSSKIDVAQCPRCRYDGYNELIEHAFLTDGLHRAFV